MAHGIHGVAWKEEKRKKREREERRVGPRITRINANEEGIFALLIEGQTSSPSGGGGHFLGMFNPVPIRKIKGIFSRRGAVARSKRAYWRFYGIQK